MKKSTSRLPQHIFLTVNSRSRAPCVTFTPSLFRSVKSDASKGKKKKVTQSDAKIASLQNVDLPNGWIKKFLALGSTDLANVLALLANEGKVSFSQLKRAGIGLPSFSSARWSELASSFNLPVDLSMSDLKAEFDHFSISPVLLPPSFHEAIAKAAWHFQDVYQEPLFHEREETHVRFLDAYYIPIIGLFQGRIIDRPEQAMISTVHSSGGEAEHELFTGMHGRILFLITELKLRRLEANNIAQLFLELRSAAEMNLNKNPNFQGMRIYGLLTDFNSFQFYSYDHIEQKFAFDDKLEVRPTAGRETFIADMIRVTNKIFSIVLSAYLDSLVVTIKTINERPLPASPTTGSHLHNPIDNTPDSETGKSVKQWELALQFGRQCQNKFQEPAHTIADAEKQSRKAINLLIKSVRSIPRISPYSGKEDPSTQRKLRALTRGIVVTEYLKIIRAQRRE